VLGTVHVSLRELELASDRWSVKGSKFFSDPLSGDYEYRIISFRISKDPQHRTLILSTVDNKDKKAILAISTF
jgi:hypothetical protein